MCLSFICCIRRMGECERLGLLWELQIPAVRDVNIYFLNLLMLFVVFFFSLRYKDGVTQRNALVCIKNTCVLNMNRTKETDNKGLFRYKTQGVSYQLEYVIRVLCGLRTRWLILGAVRVFILLSIYLSHRIGFKGTKNSLSAHLRKQVSPHEKHNIY